MRHPGVIKTGESLSELVCWGEHRVRLDLPMGALTLTGLSRGQSETVRRCYGRFVVPLRERTGMTCQALRLDAPPACAPEDLTRDGQYAPMILPHADGQRMIGTNFEALLSLDPGTPSRLAVQHEEELPLPNVLENFLRVFSAQMALTQQGVILHSAGLVFDDMAWIFQGYSNAGKTTLTRKAHAAGAHVLSDDINLLLPDEDGYQAHAVPFTGEFGRTIEHPEGRGAWPVAAIVLLEQGEHLHAEPVEPAQAVARLLTGCPFVNMDASQSDRLFDVAGSIADRLPVVRLQCRRDDDVDEIMDTVRVASGFDPAHHQLDTMEG